MTNKHQVLKDVFGFDDFRAGQEDVVDTLLDGSNVLAVMPTGSGKSLCYQIPALIKDGLTIVVSPLVALMKDQVAALNLAGVAAETMNSSRDHHDNAATWDRVRSGEVRLLYLAPERLMTPRILEALEQLPVSLIAVDEAHCISQWGPSFRREYADLARLRTIFPGVPIAALTATADALTRRDIADKLFDGDAKTVVLGFDRPNISLAVSPKRQWKRQLLDFVSTRKGQCGIVYCLSRKKTEATAEYLTDNGFRALPYHASLDKDDRDAHQDAFMSEPGLIIVATIAFGMGVDKSDVRFVFHTDLPGNVEAYYQEIGRAGRDGAPASAQMLYGLDDLRMRRVFIEEETGDDEERRRREHKRLDALIGYCEAPTCRRQTLLDYFGETSEPCGNCDLCLEPIERKDGTVEAQKILSAVYRTGQRFGVVHIVDVLRGTLNEKITRMRHDELPTFGVGADLGKVEWTSLIRQLVAGGFLHLDIEKYGGLTITEKGGELLRGKDQFLYRPEIIARPKTSAKATRGEKSAPPAANLSDAETTLLQQLRELRSLIAKERGVPAYVIFHDRSLVDMAQRRPQTVDDFAEVHGVGAAKLNDFADAFLGVLRAG